MLKGLAVRLGASRVFKMTQGLGAKQYKEMVKNWNQVFSDPMRVSNLC
jgi:hypothetical protein